MFHTPPHKQLDPAKQGAQLVHTLTLKDYIGRIDKTTGDTIEQAVPVAQALADLANAVDNHRRALRTACVDPYRTAHVTGCAVRLDAAMAAARRALAQPDVCEANRRAS